MLIQDGVPQLLGDMIATTPGDNGLPIGICADHLTRLGAREERERSGSERGEDKLFLAGELVLKPKSRGVKAAPMDAGLNCTIHWGSPNFAKRQGTEAIVQALSGLMGVHGRDRRVPRRLGLEVASVAAGIIASQGVLAALIGRSRGHKVQEIETSVLQAALVFLYHHLAIATCNDEFPFRSSEFAPGPPFPTADGHWVELEGLTSEAWIAFWKHLGVEPVDGPGPAWLPFVYRYLAGSCALPPVLHETTNRHTLAELRHAADVSGLAMCQVRGYPEVLAELGWTGGDARQRGAFGLQLGTPWEIRPGIRGQDRNPTHRLLAGGLLTGLRVIEVTSRLQGPLAGQLLRMLGAEVVKVEPPEGDIGRYSPPLAGSLGAAYLAYNRGKNVIEINYKKPEGIAHLADLVANADVFLHNWPTGRAERLGFDFQGVASGNPGLVYAHASGWGGMKSEPSSFTGDYLVQAYAGCGDGLNPPGEPPFPSRLTLIDVLGGLLACEGILAGLYLRELTGQGCRVETSLLAAAMTLQNHILQAFGTEQEAGRCLGKPRWGPLDLPIETGNGFLVMAITDEKTRRRLFEVCGLPTFAREGPLEDLMANRLRCRSAPEWESILLEAEIPAAAVCSDLAGLPRDPRVAPLLEKVDGVLWAPAAPWQFKTGT